MLFRPQTVGLLILEICRCGHKNVHNTYAIKVTHVNKKQDEQRRADESLSAWRQLSLVKKTRHFTLHSYQGKMNVRRLELENIYIYLFLFESVIIVILGHTVQAVS